MGVCLSIWVVFFSPWQSRMRPESSVNLIPMTEYQSDTVQIHYECLMGIPGIDYESSRLFHDQSLQVS